MCFWRAIGKERDKMRRAGVGDGRNVFVECSYDGGDLCWHWEWGVECPWYVGSGGEGVLMLSQWCGVGWGHEGVDE